MKKRLFGVITATLLLCTATVFASSVDTNKPVVTNHDVGKLAFQNLHLDDNTPLPKIDKNTAIENANQTFPQWAADATEVKVEYHLVTDPSFTGFSLEALEKNPDLKSKGHMEKLPAYIVSYLGMSYTGNIPPNYHGKVPVHHEYNVIVDATTGEPLMGFSYR